MLQAVETRRARLSRCRLLARAPLTGQVDLRIALDANGDATCVCLEPNDALSDPVVAICVQEELSGLHVEIHREGGVAVSLQLVADAVAPN